MRHSAFGLTAALLVCAGPVGAAVSQGPLAGGVPIQVLSVQYNDNHLPEEDESQSFPDGLVVTFKNVTPRTAKSVAFAVRDESGHKLATVIGHGTFSPGIVIKRGFGEVKMKERHGSPMQATPIEVIYDDGSQWDAKAK